MIAPRAASFMRLSPRSRTLVLSVVLTVVFNPLVYVFSRPAIAVSGEAELTLEQASDEAEGYPCSAELGDDPTLVTTAVVPETAGTSESIGPYAAAPTEPPPCAGGGLDHGDTDPLHDPTTFSWRLCAEPGEAGGLVVLLDDGAGTRTEVPGTLVDSWADALESGEAPAPIELEGALLEGVTPPADLADLPACEEEDPEEEPVGDVEPDDGSTDEPADDPCSSDSGDCVLDLDVESDSEAEVENDVEVSANTGGNVASGDEVEVETGDATVAVGVDNEVNRSDTLVDAGDDAGGADDSETPAEEGAPPADDDQTGADVSVRNQSDGGVVNDVDVSANTGGNVASGGMDGSIGTGDVNVITNVLNSVNTTMTGSLWGEFTLNVVDTYTGTINFLEMLLDFLAGVGDAAGGGSTWIENDNTASVDNAIEVNANSGGNELNLGGTASVATGDVNVATNVLNLVNSNFIGSSFFLATINILGSYTGDIILPGEGVLAPITSPSYSSLDLVNENDASVDNAIEVNANSGGNVAFGDGEHGIDTGDVRVGTQVYNQVNTNIVGSQVSSFVVNAPGFWDGTVVGAPSDAPTFAPDGSSAGSLTVRNANDASVLNDIRINANSGNNAVAVNGTARIMTGDVTVGTNLMNIVNTNVIGSNWFLGSLNLLGAWSGNIIYAYPDLTVHNDNEDAAEPGDFLRYTLTYENLGLAPAWNVSLEDAIPQYTEFVEASDGGVETDGVVRWTFDEVPAGSGERTVTFTVRVTEEVPVGETVVENHVAIATVTNEPEQENNRSMSQTVLRLEASPAEETGVIDDGDGTAAPDPAPSAELTLSTFNDADAPVLPGTAVGYTIAVANTGDVEVTEVVVSNTLTDAGGTVYFERTFTLGAIAPGTTTTIEFSLTIDEGSPPGRFTSWTVARGTADGEPVSSNSAASFVDVLPLPEPTEDEADATPAVKPATLSLEEENDVRDFVFAGDPVQFTVTVSNDGGVAINGIVVKNKLVNGDPDAAKRTRWEVGTLLPREAVKITYSLALPEFAPAGTYRNTTTASGKTDAGEKVRARRSHSSFQLRQRAPSVLSGVTEVLPSSDATFETGSLAAPGDDGGPFTLLPWWVISLILLGIVGANFLATWLERRRKLAR